MKTCEHHLQLNGVSGFVFSVRNKGQQITVSGWTNHSRFKEGDNVILHQDGGSETRYRIDKMKRPGDPPDQYFMHCTFNPRTAQ